MFRHIDCLRYLSRGAFGLTYWLLLVSGAWAQVEGGGSLGVTRLYGSDDDRWRMVYGVTVGVRLHERWWVEGLGLHRSWQSFETQENYYSRDPARIPFEVYRTVAGQSDWLQLGLALRGIAVPVGGRRRHLQYFGRLEAGWLVYRYRLARPELPAGYTADLPAQGQWSSPYVLPGAGLEWLYGAIKPFVQVGACLPLVRPDVPPGSNLSLTSSFSGTLGLRFQMGRSR